jgi:hypothetical protein
MRIGLSSIVGDGFGNGSFVFGEVPSGGGTPPPSGEVLISSQTLDGTYLSTTPSESFTFSGGSTYLTDGANVSYFSYISDTSGLFSLNLTGLTSLVSADVYFNNAMTTAPNCSGLTSLTSVNFSQNPSMTVAPNLTGCTALTTVYVNSCSLGDSTLLTMCSQILSAAGGNSGTLIMNGDYNYSFDSSSIPTEITDLVNAGWTVTYNSY